MAHFLLQAAYTRDKWREMVDEPVEGMVTEGGTIVPVIKAFGGEIHGNFGFMAFGEYDAVVIYSVNDNQTSAAISAALSSTRSFKAIKTTPLIEDIICIKAMQTAKAKGFPPAG